MQENLVKKITKLSLALGLSYLLLLDLLSPLTFITKAEVVELVPSCSGQKCFSNLTDLTVSNDGSFSLIVDSGINPFIKKIDISSGMITSASIIPLADENPNKSSIKIGISKDNKKALLFNEEKILSSSSSGGNEFDEGRLNEINRGVLLGQINQGTDCRCPSSSYFDGSLCVTGTLDCTNTNPDPVCSCDNLNFLNSCIARANGVKRFTKGGCGTASNLSCTNASQCPIGTCSNGTTFTNFACTNNICTLVSFTSEPCDAVLVNCKCPVGTFFNGATCVPTPLDCTGIMSNPVCSCDNLNFINSCIAGANGIKEFTIGACGTMSDVRCNSDSQCPTGTCLSGISFKQFACAGNKCTLVKYANDPCITITADCKCPTGNIFDEMNCVQGTLKCNDTSDPVCSCTGLDFLNSCVARANGVKRFTKGQCTSDIGLTCALDSQCPIGVCPSGNKFKKFNCIFERCGQIEFSIDPCSSSSSSGGYASSVVRVIDLTNNSIKTFTPAFFERTSSTTTTTQEGVSTVSFLDAEGKKLIASNDNLNEPKLLFINAETGEIEKKPTTIDGILNSIELTSNFKKAVLIFKDVLAHSIGILNTKTKQLIRFDIPKSIFFEIDEFLSMVDFDLFSGKAVASSLDGKHVLHILNIRDNKLTIKFLDKSKNIAGATHSAINPNGTIAVAVGNIIDENEIIVYKLNILNVRSPKLLKVVKFQDGSKAQDIKISPDSDKVLILIIKDNEKKLKILNLNDLSLLCEFLVSDDTSNSFLVSDPYGRYLLSPNFKSESVSLISDLTVGPVFKSITPDKASKEGGTQFTIDGFIDQTIFTEKVKVCFGNEHNCSMSTMISNSGNTITGITPGFPHRSLVSIILIAEKKSNAPTISSSSAEIQCPSNVNSKTLYKKAFQFE